MATESLYPNGSHSITNFTGNHNNVDSAPDGVWLSPTDDGLNNAITLAFPTPTDTLTSGAGLQTVKIHARKETTGGNNPTMTAYVRENSNTTDLATLTAGETISNDTTGVTYTYTFDASVLINSAGVGFEVHIAGARSGGSGASRRNIAIDSVEWIADYTVAETPLSVTSIPETLTLTKANTTVELEVNLSITSVPVAVTLSKTNATVGLGADLDVTATTQSLTLSPTNSTVSTENDLGVTATNVSLSLAPANASVATETDANITATTASLSLATTNTTVVAETPVQTGSPVRSGLGSRSLGRLPLGTSGTDDVVRGTTLTVPTVTGTHSNFPVLITDGDLPDAIFDIADGGSLRAYTDSTKATQLPLEVVSFNTISRTCEIWVKVSSVSTGATVYLESDPALTALPVTDTYGRNAVWSEYEAVWHMGSTTDSTGNGYDLTFTGSLPTVVAGQIGDGQDFSGSDTATFPSTGTLFDGSNDFEVSTWFESIASDNFNEYLFYPRADYAYYLRMSGTNAYASVWDGSETSVVSTTDVDSGKHHIYGTYDADGNMDLYIDGSQEGTAVASPTPDVRTDSNLIGAQNTTSNRWNGIIDEFRIRTSLTNANYKATEYDNQNTATWLSNDGWSEPSSVVIEQTATDRSTSGARATATYPSATTSGNILFAILSFGHSGYTDLAAPTGWTLDGTSQINANCGTAIAYKVSDGTETSVTFISTTTAPSTETLWIGEVSGLTGTTPHITSDYSYSSLAVTSLTLTTATTTVPDTFALAGFAVDSGNNEGANGAWTNSFVEVERSGVGMSGSSVSVGSKTNTTTGIVSTEFSHDGTADQMSGGLIVWEAGAAVGTDLDVTATTGSLTLAGSNATVGLGADLDVTANNAVLSLTKTNTTVSTGSDLSITSSPVSISITSSNTTVVGEVDLAITASTASLSLSTTNTSVSTGSNLNVTTSPVVISVTPSNTSVVVDIDIAATSASLSLVATNAAISLNNDLAVNTTPASLSLVKTNALVSAQTNLDVTATTEVLTLVVDNASIATENDLNTSVSTASLTLVKSNSTIGTTVDANVTASSKALTLVASNPTVDLGADLSVTTVPVTLTLVVSNPISAGSVWVDSIPTINTWTDGVDNSDEWADDPLNNNVWS